MKQELLQQYADAIVQVGINLQKGDKVLVRIDSRAIELGRLVVKRCWQMGAKDVKVRINDQEMSRAYFDASDDSVFDYFPQFEVDYAEELYKAKYHRIAIGTPSLDLYADVDQDRMNRDSITANTALKPLDKYMDSGEIKWVVAMAASEKWAKSLFPELPAEEGVEKLWEKILEAARIQEGQDAVKNWQEHDAKLKAYEKWLDEQQFVSLHYEAPGTDLVVGLAEKHKWVGGSSRTPDGIDYMANMPTEEIFTCPHNKKINGRVQSTKPLNNSGKMIEDFWFEFKDGKVVDYDAAQGKEVLDMQLGMDEGAKSLGEVALVPNSSPISKMGFVFKNTLFDENASCHFALGAAYSETLIGGEQMKEEERKALGYNDSMIHIDFMVGGPELRITGTKADGSEVIVMDKGEWAMEL